MKRYLFLLLQLCLLLPLHGQTIIELSPGGRVRGKTAEEYRKNEPGLAEKLRADSLQYNDHLTRAFNALYRDSIRQAEVLLNEALKLRPNAPSNFIVRHYLGRIDMARGDFRKAIATFTVLLKDRPENREVRFDRASCYLEIKNSKAAIEDCNSIFKQELSKDERIKALFLRSACHTEERHPEMAKADLETILSIEANHESAQLLLALTYDQLGQPQEALNRLNLFVHAHPQSVEGLIARAELEEKLDMKAAARADYDQAITLSPQSPTAYVKRACLLLHMDLRHLAEKDVRQAIKLGYPAEQLRTLLSAPQ